MAIASINPATGEKLKEFSPFDDAEIAKRLKLAENASSKYRRTRFIDRSVLLEAVAELLFQEKKKFAEIITLEMGKLLRASVEEIEKCARVTALTRGLAITFSTCSGSISSVWKTPSANPARQKISSMASAHCGTLDACFSSPTLPAMSAGAANRNTCQNGKFHGMMASTGPSG